MNTNECWLAMHELCSMPAHCDCLCHVESYELLDELDLLLLDNDD